MALLRQVAYYISNVCVCIVSKVWKLICILDFACEKKLQPRGNQFLALLSSVGSTFPEKMSRERIRQKKIILNEPNIFYNNSREPTGRKEKFTLREPPTNSPRAGANKL